MTRQPAQKERPAMPLPRWAVSNRFNFSAFAPALAIMLLPGLIRPQAAAQRPGANRRAPGGGGGRMVPYNPPAQMRPRAGAFNPGPRPPMAYRPVSRTVPGRVIRSNRQAIHASRGNRRSLHARSIQRRAFNYDASRYRLSGQEWRHYFPSGSAYYTHYHLKPEARATVPSVYYY